MINDYLCKTYNCTLLKDLPDYPAGTEFKVQEYIWCKQLNQWYKFKNDDGYYSSGNDIPKSVVDNPIWVKKELSDECITDMSCPHCGGTRFIIDAFDLPSKYDDGVRYFYMKVSGECVDCGAIRDFYKFQTCHRLER